MNATNFVREPQQLPGDILGVPGSGPAIGKLLEKNESGKHEITIVKKVTTVLGVAIPKVEMELTLAPDKTSLIYIGGGMPHQSTPGIESDNKGRRYIRPGRGFNIPDHTVGLVFHNDRMYVTYGRTSFNGDEIISTGMGELDNQTVMLPPVFIESIPINESNGVPKRDGISGVRFSQDLNERRPCVISVASLEKDDRELVIMLPSERNVVTATADGSIATGEAFRIQMKPGSGKKRELTISPLSREELSYHRTQAISRARTK